MFKELVLKADSLHMEILLRKFQNEVAELKKIEDLPALKEKQSLEMKSKLYNFNSDNFDKAKEVQQLRENHGSSYFEKKIAEYKDRNKIEKN